MSSLLNYLAAHSRNLEALLQTYRQIDLTTQSVFFVLGTLILSRLFETNSMHIAIFLEFLLFCIALFSVITMRRFQRVIDARGGDVNWWHRKIVEAEQSLPPEERIFTKFKAHQSKKTLSNELISKAFESKENLTKEEINLLLEADQGNVRRVINSSITRSIRLLWFALIILGIGSIIVRWFFIE